MSDTTEKTARETPTELLIRVLGEFSNEEPKDVIVCWTTERPRVWTTRTNMDDLRAIGILETAKTTITDEMGDDDDDEGEQE